MDKKTIRLLFPEWQGGIHPGYAMGAEILSLVAPQGQQCETIRVPVAETFDKELEFTHGTYETSAILAQQKTAYQLVEAHQPDQIGQIFLHRRIRRERRGVCAHALHWNHVRPGGGHAG